MSESYLVNLFKHNNWANYQVIRACRDLSDEQLDTDPATATVGNIRKALQHLIGAQQGYLSLLTGGERRYNWGDTFPGFDELEAGSHYTGAGFLELARGAATQDPVRTRSGYIVAPWVVMLQIINHATEHREQIKSMLSALEITPPEIDGWDFGIAVGAAWKGED